MNYYSVTINLKTSEQNLPWYIIEQSITKEGKYLRQSCCPGMFAIITLRIEPDPVKQVAVFEKKITEIDLGCQKMYPLPEKNEETLLDLQMICSGVILGIEAAWFRSRF